jgi:hypothetical protein
MYMGEIIFFNNGGDPPLVFFFLNSFTPDQRGSAWSISILFSSIRLILKLEHAILSKYTEKYCSMRHISTDQNVGQDLALHTALGYNSSFRNNFLNGY